MGYTYGKCLVKKGVIIMGNISSGGISEWLEAHNMKKSGLLLEQIHAPFHHCLGKPAH